MKTSKFILLYIVAAKSPDQMLLDSKGLFVTDKYSILL